MTEKRIYFADTSLKIDSAKNITSYCVISNHTVIASGESSYDQHQQEYDISIHEYDQE